MQKLLLIDSSSLIYRAFYAIKEMRTIDGFPTNAIHGFFSMLSKILQDENPTHIAATFDRKEPTFRHELFPDYKANRKPTPDELIMQIDVIKKLLDYLGIKTIEQPGYEADDLIGTISQSFKNTTLILSGDRDLYQLVDDNTFMLYTIRGVSQIDFVDKNYLEKIELTPQKVVEYKALAGDSADNIPGARGIGDKTAKEILSKYDNIEEIYANIENFNPSLKKKLLESKEKVHLSKQLASINKNVSLNLSIDSLEFKYELTPSFVNLLLDLECKTVADKFINLMSYTHSDSIKKDAVEINSLVDLKHVIANIKSEFAFLISEDIFFAVNKTHSFKIICNKSLLDEGLNFDDAVIALKSILEDTSVKKIAYDLKETMHFLKRYDIKIRGDFDDILIKQYLINSSRIPQDLEDLALIYRIDNVDASTIFAINKEQHIIIKDKGLSYLYSEIEKPLLKVLFDMEQVGFRVDTIELNYLHEKYQKIIDNLREQIYLIAGRQFNINSNPQLAEVLYQDLNLNPSKKTKSGFSVSADVLENINHPIIAYILEYRKFTKLVSTYITGLKNKIDQSTSKIHTYFKQNVTVTGRLSSTEPNMQNIPIKTEEGREIRKALIPSEGNVLISADYSQIELRLLAHFSEDEKMISLFEENADIHTATAAQIFKLDTTRVTENMRRDAKAVNFGIIYGISAYGLAQTIGVSNNVAQKFIESYFSTFKHIKSYLDSNVTFARENGYIRSISGRIRYFSEFKSKNKNLQNFAARAAMNMPLQGSAADIVKMAMIKVYEEIIAKQLNAKIILQVHDEILIDCPQNELGQVKNLLKDCMENIVKLNVPLIVDVKSGSNWFNLS